ncbi:MAG: lamin tail domain-containing protein [Candidatus Marinimicrobia bacterium]|nr:lamin tail domain-containing protein [Candidatus Neomarinimicrobiota bacterium]
MDSINANGVVGIVNLILDADTLREPSFTFNADLSADSNVVVKPATGRDVVLIVAPGVSHGNGAQMIGFDKGFVTFDGSNDGTDSRNLIITTEGTVALPVGINKTGVENVVIKNLIIKNLDNGASNFKYGIASNDIGGNDFDVINCQIGSADHPTWRDGIAVWGDWTNGYGYAKILNNDIHAGARGISTYISAIQVENNNITIHPSANTSYTYAYGVYLSWVKETVVANNVISILEKSTLATKLVGIASASHPSGALASIYNNMVTVGASDETRSTLGFGVVSDNPGYNYELYNNTFVINDNSSTVASYGIGHTPGYSGSLTMDLKNNIIINNHTGNVGSSAIGLTASTSVLTSNNNILVSDQNCVNYLGTAYENLADWQAAGQDAASDSLAVTFVSATDLHLATPSDTDLNLVMPSVGVMEDIDGDARDIFYAYAGADEGTAYPTSNDLDLTFDDATDVANWSHWTSTNGYTVEAWDADDSVLVLSDGGYGMSDERAVKATVGSVYKLSIDIKTSLWDVDERNNLDLSVQGLGNDDVSISIMSDSVWTTFTLIGIAEAENGYIRIDGYKAGTVDTVFVDNVVWDDQYKDVVPSPNIASLISDVSVGDDCAGICVLTAVTIGAPAFGQDDNAGIALYEWDIVSDSNIQEGDEILFVGERAVYNGLEQVSNIDDYIVLSKGNVVEPTIITVPDLVDYHGMLVMIEDVDTVAGFTWPAYSSSQTLTDGTNEFVMRIDSDGEMVDSPPPASWPLDLIGVVGWYNDPQMMPRYMADFITNQAPADFMILNPTDSTVITSFEDPNVEKIDMDGDSVYALFTNWETAVDPEGDSLTYEMIFIGDGPEEEIVTADTFLYIPLDQETSYEMNGIYTYYYTATDPKGKMGYSDTNTITFDFPAPDLFFSEYVEGSGNSKAIEIYNGNVDTVNLSDYTVKGTHNGDNDWNYCTFPLPNKKLAPGDVYIFANSEADAIITAIADTLLPYTTNTIASFNGDDARGIFKDSVLIDVIGIPDEDPGSAWDVAGGLGATAEYTLVRKSTVTIGNTDWAASAGIDATSSEWVVMPQNTFSFLGSHPHTDFTFPTIGGSVAEESLIQIRYSEEVDSTNALDVANYSVDGSAPTSVTKINSTVYTLDAGTITPNTDVQVIVTNLVDNIGLKTDADTTICQYLTIDITAAADKYFCEWETDLGPASWWVPTGSGSTYGILGTSTFAMSSDAAYQGTQSAKLDIKDDSATDGGWFVREYNSTKDNIAYDSKLYMLVKCDAPDVQIRFVVDDDGSSGDSGYETSRWFDITATGDDWQVISLDLVNDPVYGWINGNDAIESTDEVSVSSIQLQCAEDVDAVLYFDILTERPAGTDAVTFNTLPEKFALHQNYPNPFNPTTNIQFDLPKAVDVKLVIYDIMGRKITTLVNTHMEAGYKNIVWNGTNDYGNKISSGIYIYRIIAGNNIETMKMSYIK